MANINDIKLNELAAGIREELAAIDTDNRSALGHAIAAGEKLNEAKKHVEHGEWLPWLAANFDLTRRTATSYMRLAANGNRVSHLDSVNEALAAIKDEKPPQVRRKRSNGSASGRGEAQDPAVLEWVRRQKRRGLIAGQIVEKAKAGDDDWPGKEDGLSKGSMTSIEAAIAAEDRVRAEYSGKKPAPTKKEGPGRERTAAQKRRRAEAEQNVALSDLLRMQERLAKIVHVLETTDFHAEFTLDDIASDALMNFADNLVATIDWCQRALPAVEARMGDLKVMELVRKLEDTKGRSPEEAVMFKRRAKMLRSKHGLELVA